MEIPWWYWIIAVTGLWMAKCGIWWTVVPLLLVAVFLYGALCELYSKSQHNLSVFQSNIYCDVAVKPGIRKIVEETSIGEPIIDNTHKPLTSSPLIDQNIQDIIAFIIRDNISPWYQKISANDGFEKALTESLRKIAESIAIRMEKVAWIQYLTTRLVDDAASHLKLYRLACEQMKGKKVTTQTLASFKSATQGTTGGHSRDNSDGGGKFSSIKCHSRNSSTGEKAPDLETLFFRLESKHLEVNRMSHEKICTNRDAEKRYLDNIVDIIMFQVLPKEDFGCLPARTLLREIVIGGVLLPLIDMFSEPDCINAGFVGLCKDVGLTSEAFFATLRATDNKNELTAILDVVEEEIAMLRSRDSGGEDDAMVRQKLSSLLFVKKSIDTRVQGGSLQKEKKNSSPTHIVNLPLKDILGKNLPLSYFIDYLSSIEMQNYVFVYLDMESWKASAIQWTNEKTKPVEEGLRDGANYICQKYFLDDSRGRVRIDAAIESQLISKIAREPVNEKWFDDLGELLEKKLQERCLADFYRSNIYIKLLSDLELLKDNDEDSQSPDSVSLTDSLEDEDMKKEPEFGTGKFQLNVEIIDSDVVEDKGKTYGVYALSVERTYQNGYSEKWHVYRRYSDFYDFQQKVKDAYHTLGKLSFPGKKTFNNMGSLTLLKRKKMLNDYLQILLHSGMAERYERLPVLLLAFLEPGEYDKAMTLTSAFESVVSPIKSSMRSMSAAVRTVPDNFLSTVDGLSRSLNAGRKETENVPLRIMLLLMDEVFDLQSRNQWLRRHIVALLRQMFGDIVNRKILDYVEELTGASRVAGFLESVKELLWPNGERAGARAERDEKVRLRTKVIAKTALLSALSDDMKHLLGSETTRRGLLRVYSTFQHPVINRRLVYVFLEGLVEMIFPPITDIHIQLSRLQNERK